MKKNVQIERDKRYKENMKKKKLAKICIIFPIEYREELQDYAARKRDQWENERKNETQSDDN